MRGASAAIAEAPGPLPPAPPILRFDGVNADAGSAAAGLSFTLPANGLLAIADDPEHHASRLLQCAALRALPRAGTVWLDGRDTRTLTRRQAARWRGAIGYLCPRPSALDHLSVFDNAALPRRLAGEKPADYTGPVGELLRWVNLWRHSAARPMDLSVAEQRRLSLAMALSRAPELLIANRPVEGLDELARVGLLRLIGEAHAAGAAVLLAGPEDTLATLGSGAILRLRRGRPELDQGWGFAAS